MTKTTIVITKMLLEKLYDSEKSKIKIPGFLNQAQLFQNSIIWINSDLANHLNIAILKLQIVSMYTYSLFTLLLISRP